MDIGPPTGDPYGLVRLAPTPLALTIGLALHLACNAEGGASSTNSASLTDSSATGTSSESTGTPTTGDAETLQRCQPTCTADSDCTIGGTDIGFRCVTGVCRPPPCSDDAACILTLSGWTTPCADQSACSVDQACVAVGDEGRCATRPSMDLQCIDLGLAERTLPTIAGDMNVTVCGVLTASCDAGICSAPCTSDAACPAQLGHPTCELATGACICTEDRDCQDTMKPGLIACIAGRCGCRSDMDCTGGVNVDICFAGACGCSGPATCSTQVFDAAVQICGPA